MPTRAPDLSIPLTYIPFYPDVSGGDRVGAVSRIDGSLTPVLANNIEYLRRRSGLGQGIDPALLAQILADIATLQVDVTSINNELLILEELAGGHLNEIPGGLINSSNTHYTTSAPFIQNTLRVYLNGDRLYEGIDYTEGSDLQSFDTVVPPTTGWHLVVDYGIEGISGGAGSGSVTRVGLTMPSSDFTVVGSPVTAAGTLVVTWASKAANLVFAGPTSGLAATPGFRQLIGADLPVMIGDSGLGGVQGAVPAPAVGDAAAGKVLGAGGGWVVPASYKWAPATQAANGSRKVFAVPNAFVSGTLLVVADGQVLVDSSFSPGDGADYSVSGQNVTIASARAAPSSYVAFYYQPTA